MKFIRFIFDIFNVFTKASEIRQDNERRDKTVRFAVSSIAYSLIAVIAVTLGSFLLSVKEDSGILLIFVLIIAIGFIAGGIVTYIGSILRVIAQFTLNRKFMTWLSLIILILSIIASVMLIFHFI